MKTLEQIAKAAGVTRAAIYKRFQSYGLSVTSLKGEKQGKTILYGDNIEKLILFMFQPENGNGKSETETIKTQENQGLNGSETVTGNGNKPEIDVYENGPDSEKTEEGYRTVENTVTEQEKRIQELKALLAKMEGDASAAKEVTENAEKRAAEAEARADRAEARNELLLSQIDKLTDAIRAAEAIQASQLAKLMPAAEQKTGGMFARLREKFRNGKER